MGVPDEAGDPGRVAHGGPRLVGEVHADEDVAGELVALDLLALPLLDLDDLFLRHLDVVDELLHRQRGTTVLEVVLHPVLVAGVGVHDVPVTGQAQQVVAELLARVDLGLGGFLTRSAAAVLVGLRGRLGSRSS